MSDKIPQENRVRCEASRYEVDLEWPGDDEISFQTYHFVSKHDKEQFIRQCNEVLEREGDIFKITNVRSFM